MLSVNSDVSASESEDDGVCDQVKYSLEQLVVNDIVRFSYWDNSVYTGRVTEIVRERSSQELDLERVSIISIIHLDQKYKACCQS